MLAIPHHHVASNRLLYILHLLVLVSGMFAGFPTDAASPASGAVLSDRLDRLLAPDAQRDDMQGVATVILHATDVAAVQQAVQAQGDYLRYHYHDMIEVRAPLVRLRSLLAALPAGTLARLPYPHTADSVTSAGVTVTGAGDMQALGNAGAGIQVGIIDLGFTSYANSQASGELPASLAITDYTGNGTGGTNHGTNVAEIVHDMAPGADLYLARIDSSTQLAAAVSDMVSAGVDVIVHSVAWFGAAYYDGTGPLCDIVNDAAVGGIAWFNAMGNSRNKHYEGTFTDSNSNLRHDFGGQEYDTIAMNANQTAKLVLNWDDYPSTRIDYDLYLYDGDPSAGGTVVDSSTNRQSGVGPLRYPEPFEALEFTAPANIAAGTLYYVVVRKANSSQQDINFTLHSLNHNLSLKVTARSLVQPADCANAAGVAATNVASDAAEGFSSEGPNKAGLNKPDIAAPDRIQTSLVTSFTGTSAAAPHAGGAAALLLADNPGISPANLRSLLAASAHDVATIGFDYRTGPGRISLDADADSLNHDDESLYGSNPLSADTDADGLADGAEVFTYGTSPILRDTDGDGFGDAVEIAAGTVADSASGPWPAPDGDLAPFAVYDGLVNSGDLLVGERMVLGLTAQTELDQAHADFNGNGTIDLPDLLHLMTQVLGN